MDEESLEELIARLKQYITNKTRAFLLSSEDEEGESPDYDEEDVDVWEADIAKNITESFAASAMLGAETNALPAAVMTAIAAALALQLGYLKDFANQLRDNAREGQTGRVPPDQRNENYMSGAQIRARANMYAGALRAPFFIGFTGALPLPAMPTEGTLCHTNCKCSWQIVEIDAEAGDVDAYWRRSADDSCQTCIVREMEWSPVRIRGGLLEL